MLASLDRGLVELDLIEEATLKSLIHILFQIERDLIRQRTMEGLQAARARGRNGGRPPKDESKIKLALNMYESKVCSISQILETTGISKTTLYRYIRQRRKLS